MTIATEIAALYNDKTAIATAITNKGGTVGVNDGFDDFASDIGTIPSDQYGNVVEIENIMHGTNTTEEASLTTAANDISQFLYGVSND